ncbi:hypothetical protein [Thalassococcus sp. S3]|uniref:hypothetical protein n=1 Tax=Thalassococcus sp. S3 TaxID=2017482 RepID=UPI001024067D|nr:hypothetical protein [Thalassococcus sp. S3]QBF33339.1 hypothetical protein CFI11_19255 [Thalassococcus sp. S3]
MRLIGLDIIEDFRSQNEREAWVWEVDALMLEVANRIWSDPKELLKDYPTAETNPPNVTFKLAGGRVLVKCIVLFKTGLVVLKQVVLDAIAHSSKTLQKSGGAV